MVSQFYRQIRSRVGSIIRRLLPCFPTIAERILERQLRKVPYTRSTIAWVFDYLVHRSADIQPSETRSAQRVLVYDNIFPHLKCSFTTCEFNAYLERFPEACVYTSGTGFAGFGGDTSFDAVHADFASKYPHLANRVYKVNTRLDYHAELFYTLFLSNMFLALGLVEAMQVPFVFTLYSGGDFCMYDPESDSKLRRIFSSPFFRKVIVGQSPARDYLLERSLVEEHQIEFIYGPICNTEYLLKHAEPKKFYAQDKSTFDICFVAYKHMPLGRDKGYDIFVQVARILSRRSPDFHFHVVGGFTPEDINVSDLGGRIHFYGKQPMGFFSTFHSSMDIMLSPCLPFVLAPGAFDGAPNVSAIEAGLCGVAVFMTDQLKQNLRLRDREEIVVVPHDAWVISDIVESYFRDVDALYRMARQGQAAFARVFNMQAQIEPRIKLFESLLNV